MSDLPDGTGPDRGWTRDGRVTSDPHRLPRIVAVPSVNNAGWRAVGTDDAYRYAVTTLSVYWSEVEHGRLIERWPHLVCEVGATWDEHRRKIERHCVLVDRAGHTVNQTSGSVWGFEAFLAERDINTPSGSDLQAYPDLRTQPSMLSWPPPRSGPCWCGSGRKYKLCCRPHGLGRLD